VFHQQQLRIALPWTEWLAGLWLLAPAAWAISARPAAKLPKRSTSLPASSRRERGRWSKPGTYTRYVATTLFRTSLHVADSTAARPLLPFFRLL